MIVILIPVGRHPDSDDNNDPITIDCRPSWLFWLFVCYYHWWTILWPVLFVLSQVQHHDDDMSLSLIFAFHFKKSQKKGLHTVLCWSAKSLILPACT